MVGGGTELAATISEVSVAVIREKDVIPTMIHRIERRRPGTDLEKKIEIAI